MYSKEIEYLIANCKRCHKPTTIAHVTHMACQDRLIFSRGRWYAFGSHSWRCISPSEYIGEIRRIYCEAMYIAETRVGIKSITYQQLFAMTQKLLPDNVESIKLKIERQCRKLMHNHMFAYELNKNQHLFACFNGVLEFHAEQVHGRCVQFRDGVPGDMMTLTAHVHYMPYTSTDADVKHMESILQILFANREERESLLNYVGMRVAGFDKKRDITNLWRAPSNLRVFQDILLNTVGNPNDLINTLYQNFRKNSDATHPTDVSYITAAMYNAMLSILVNAYEPHVDSAIFWTIPLEHSMWRKQWYPTYLIEKQLLHTELVASVITKKHT